MQAQAAVEAAGEHGQPHQLDGFIRCLERCMRTGATPRSMALAATCSLRLGHPGKALQLASRAMFLKPTEEHRQLVRLCTKELEYQGRQSAMQELIEGRTGSNMMPGAAGSVLRLLSQLEREGPNGVAEALRTLSRELVLGGIDAQVAFDLLGGYERVLMYWTPTHYQDALQVLLAAGICQLHTTLQHTAHGLDLGTLLSTGSPGAATSRGPIRVRWPLSVLGCLLDTVLSTTRTSGGGNATALSGWTPMAECAMSMLALAGLDAHQRQLGFSCAPEPPQCAPEAKWAQPRAASHLRTQASSPRLGPSEDEVSVLLSSLVNHLAEGCSLTSTGSDVEGSSSSLLWMFDSDAATQSCASSEEVVSARSALPETVFRAGSAGGTGDSLLRQLMNAVWDKRWLGALPGQIRVYLAQLVSGFASDSKLDRQVLRQATEGKTFSTLLRLYQATQAQSTAGDRAGGLSAAASEAACRTLQRALLRLCEKEPALLKSESFMTRRRQPSGPGGTTAPGVKGIEHYHGIRTPSTPGAGHPYAVLVPTPLIGQIVEATRKEFSRWQENQSTASAGGNQWAHLRPASPHARPCVGGSTLLEGWVALLGAVAMASRVAAQELYRCGALDALQMISERCTTTHAALVQAVASTYGIWAKQCQEMAQAIFDSSCITALLGMATYSGHPSLVLVALDRLSPLVSTCPSDSYQHVVCQPGAGVLAASHQLMLLSLSARKVRTAADGDPSLLQPGSASTQGTGVKAVHPWEAALAAAREAVTLSMPPGAAGGFGSPFGFGSPPPAPDFNLPQTGALRDAAQCLLLSCLDRSRREANLKPMQAPRDGYWSSVRPRDLLMLERRLRQDWAAALLPQLPTSASPSQPCLADNAVPSEQPCLIPGGWRQSADVWSPPKRATTTSHQAAGTSATAASRPHDTASQSQPSAPASPLPLAPQTAAAVFCTVRPSEASSDTACQGPASPVLTLRSRRSDSLEDTAHKDSGHSSLCSPLHKSSKFGTIGTTVDPCQGVVLEF